MKIVFALVCAGLLFEVCASQLSSDTATDPESVRLIASIDGNALYQAYCATCHGPDARGTGPAPDLTRIAQRRGGVYPDALVERIISGEEPLSASHGANDMPVWGPTFSQVGWDRDLGRLRIHNLATYIRKLQAK